MQTNKNRQNINDNTVEGANMKLKNTNRERLLDGTEKLNGQGGQIGRIMDVAVDTHGNMQSANRELKD